MSAIGNFMNADATRIVAGIGLLGSLLIIAYGATNIWTAKHAVPAQATIAAPVISTGVWATAHSVARGQHISAADLVFMHMAPPFPAGAQTLRRAILGKIAIINMPPSSVILSDDISSDPARAGLAQIIPDGLRAVSLLTNDEISVANFVRPGDHVDVEEVLPKAVMPHQNGRNHSTSGDDSEARVLLQDVLVLAVGHSLATKPPGSTPPANGRQVESPHVVTLALAPDQVSKLLLARSLGRVFLTLRNPTDIAAESANADTLANILAPPPPSTASTSTGRRKIELITGTKSKIIYSINPGETR